MGRFECLHDDFQFVCNKLKINKKLSHVNPSIHKPYTEYYDDKSRKFVRQNARYLIKYCGYEFGEPFKGSGLKKWQFPQQLSWTMV